MRVYCVCIVFILICHYRSYNLFNLSNKMAHNIKVMHIENSFQGDGNPSYQLDPS